MTSEQYHALLRDLAHVAGLPDSLRLVRHGRLGIGECRAVLVHEPAYDPDILQLRLILGSVPEALKDVIAQALLEANYVEGYGGECVFSLAPESGDAVLTMRLHLPPTFSAQELWQELSDIARHGSQMWEAIVSHARPPQGIPAEFHTTARRHI